MIRNVRAPRLARPLQPIAGFVLGAVGAAILSIATSQGYLHATVVTGAGYTGSTTPLDPVGQLLMLFAWIGLGGIAGFVGRSGLAFVGLWLGALAGSVVGFFADPDGNILWLDVIVTVVGISLFVTPGFALGSALAARQEGLDPDGSGKRPPPAPLWTRGTWRTLRGQGPTARLASPDRASATTGRSSPAGRRGVSDRVPPVEYPPSAYARPGSSQSE